jgi:hypothetical protein
MYHPQRKKEKIGNLFFVSADFFKKICGSYDTAGSIDIEYNILYMS